MASRVYLGCKHMDRCLTLPPQVLVVLVATRMIPDLTYLALSSDGRLVGYQSPTRAHSLIARVLSVEVVSCVVTCTCLLHARSMA